MSTCIKRASPEDAMAISRIYASSWKTAYRGIVPQQYLDELQDDFWESMFQKSIKNNCFRADLFYVDDTPAGCVAYGKARDEQLPDWGEITSIYIHPDFYRKGYGEKLLNSALKYLKESGYQDCYLWVLSENSNAQKFYEANGFIATKEICNIEILGKLLTDIKYQIHFSSMAE